MDRADRIGYWVSGAAHLGVLGFAILGGALFRPQPLEAVRMAEVSTMSEAEFQALASAAEGRAPLADVAATTPAQPKSPATEDRAGAPEAQSPPAPDEAAAELSAPARPEARPDLSDLQKAAPVEVATLAPQPEPPASADSAAARPASASRPQPARQTPAALAPVEPGSTLAPQASARPRGRPDGLAEA
ncbi:protein TolA, partial [Paracoccus limosus]|nr:protein TolA [Paracoccus limosus]